MVEILYGDEEYLLFGFHIIVGELFECSKAEAGS